MMKVINNNIMFLICLFLVCAAANNSELPCAARHVSGESVVCVCNATYCDTISTEVPQQGTYIAYTSSQGGLRFRESRGTIDVYEQFSTCCSITLELDVKTQYQTIKGFGGAVTDAAGMNWKSLSEPLQKYFIDSYFSDTGIEYNMIRVPIGGTDFSTHTYAYNDLPEDDAKLSNFSLSAEDYQFKLPLIKQALGTSSTPIHVIGSTWSPPPWMKSNHDYIGFSHLKPEYYQTYADYHYKFLEEYTKEGVPIWAITTTNEPISGTMGTSVFNVLGWTSTNMGKWIAEHLGPTIRDSRFKDVKIIAADEQRLILPYLFSLMVLEHPKALQYIDGVGVHYYTDFLPPAVLAEVNKNYPDKFIIATEACEGSSPWQEEKVVLGSWQRARNYIIDIIENLNHHVVGWIDWNICLNEQGGPNWAENYADSPVIVNVAKDEFYKQPMFYAIGHFSKFVPRNSKRIKVTENRFFFQKSVENVAFFTPRNTIVAILFNEGRPKTVRIKFGNLQAIINMERGSITTIEFPNSAN